MERHTMKAAYIERTVSWSLKPDHLLSYRLV